MATATASAEPPDPSKKILIRSVWAHNLDDEFSLISTFVDDYPFVSMDTEFPGVIHNNYRQLNPTDLYQTLKSNVDSLKLIQVGLTLTDSSGELPGSGFIWEFNFSDFDVARDDHAPNSIDLLRSQGTDFDLTRRLGVPAGSFVERFMSSGLVCNPDVTYITFHSGYDFGYLIKAVTGKSLPGTLPGFLELLRVYFGESVYDVKHLMKFCQGLYGGLDRVARTLGVERAAGKGHQAGSDSLLTWHVFERIREVYFGGGKNGLLERYVGVLYGLEMKV